MVGTGVVVVVKSGTVTVVFTVVVTATIGYLIFRLLTSADNKLIV